MIRQFLPCVLAFFSSSLFGEEIDGQRLTLKTGRVLEGLYNSDSGKLEMISENGSRIALAVKADDIAKIENVTLVINVISKADQDLKKRKLERAGVQLSLKTTREQLEKITITPEVTLEGHRKRIIEVQEHIPTAIKNRDEIRKVRDDYKRQVALRESTTTTTTVTDTTTRVDVETNGQATGDGVYGDAWWARYREQTTAQASKRAVTSVTKEVTANAAREELAKLDHQVMAAEDAVVRMGDYVTYLKNRVVTIEKLMAEKAQWENRLVELDKLIEGHP